MQRWQAGGILTEDRRPQRQYTPSHALTEDERGQVLAAANSDEFADLPPSQIVPRLADQGIYMVSESTFRGAMPPIKTFILFIGQNEKIGAGLKLAQHAILEWYGVFL